MKGGEAEAFRMLDNLQLVKLAVSLGGTESLGFPPGVDDALERAGRAPQTARYHRQSRARVDWNRKRRTIS